MILRSTKWKTERERIRSEKQNNLKINTRENKLTNNTIRRYGHVLMHT
jgi:hypothetical protein